MVAGMVIVSLEDNLLQHLKEMRDEVLYKVLL